MAFISVYAYALQCDLCSGVGPLVTENRPRDQDEGERHRPPTLDRADSRFHEILQIVTGAGWAIFVRKRDHRGRVEEQKVMCKACLEGLRASLAVPGGG